MKSLKIKYDDNHAIAVAGGTTCPDGYFPSLSIPSKAIPELADKSVGDTCMLTIKVKITGINSDNNGTRVSCDVLAGEYYDQEDAKDGGADDAAEGE